MPLKVGDRAHLETLDVQKTNISNLPHTVTKPGKFEQLKSLPRGLIRDGLREVGEAKLLRDVQVAKQIGELAATPF